MSKPETRLDAALLVVDDIDDNRFALTRRLAREGYKNLTTAGDGQEALELLNSRPFDLVLLDIMMPKLNGYEVLERMKADGRLRHIPVIMISAIDELDSVIRCIELGAEDYLPKPFNPTLLRARVGASLERKRLHDQVMARRASSPRPWSSRRRPPRCWASFRARTASWDLCSRPCSRTQYGSAEPGLVC